MPIAISERIPQINDRGVELLGAAGVEDCGSLSRSDPGSLLAEMKEANRHLELVESLPSLDEVIAWISQAREIQDEEGGPLVTRLEEFIEMAPVEVMTAIPFNAASIKKNKIAVSEVPEMVEFLGPDDFMEERVVKREGDRVISVPVREIGQSPSKRNSPDERGSGEGGDSKVEPLKGGARLDIRKTASMELNQGKKLHSRNYVRGVLHPTPAKVKVGALLTILSFVLFPATLLVGVLVITVFRGQPILDHLWIPAIPVAFLLFGLSYLIWAKPVKCRVCGQPVFSTMACRRNPKAHHVPLLGYIFPTALHLWIFHWFRCTYCGTSVRLKR